jgi:heme/copper-type cytochrome/quinol oxidase subunit 2
VVACVFPAILFPALTGLGFLQFGPVPYILAVLLAAGVANALVDRGWLGLVGGVLSFAFVAMNLPFILPSASHPERYPDYIFSMLLVPLCTLGLVGGIAGFIAKRRGTAKPAGWGTWAASLTILVVGVALGASVASVQTHILPGTGGSAVALTPDSTVQVTLKGDAFVPDHFTIPAGKVVKFMVDNQDTGTHDFSIDALQLRTDILAGKTTAVWVRMDQPGTYQLYCSIHSSKGADGTWTGMVATLTVE